MVSHSRKYLNVLLSFFLAIFVCGCPEGCAQPNEKDSKGKQNRRADSDDVTAKIAKLDSAGDFITVDDLEKFRPGRPKNEILKDLRWRSGYFLAAKCNGKSITSINYTLYTDISDIRRNEVVHAIFVNDRFEKFVRWETMHDDRSRGKRMKVGDYCDWLNRAVESKAVSVDELRKEVKSIKAPPEHIDPGLTAVYLAMRALDLLPGPPPRDKDYEKLRRNIALRDQFNAARLSIGMTEAEVQATVKGNPLESGKVEAGNYSIYGSNESFNVNDWLCFSPFSNILVVFRDGKAVAISSVGAGYDWRQRLEKTLIDLPKRAAASDSSNSPSDRKK